MAFHTTFERTSENGMQTRNPYAIYQADPRMFGSHKTEQDDVAASISSVVNEPTNAGVLETSTPIQPQYTPGSLPSEYELATTPLKDRQAGEHVIMAGMEEYPRSEGMEVSTPPTENARMDLDMATDSVLAELYEQQLDRYHGSDGPTHRGFMPAAGFAGDALIARPWEYTEDADWDEDIEDEDDEFLVPPETFTPFPGFLLDESSDMDTKLAEMLKEVEAWNKAHTGPVEPPEEDTYVAPTPVEHGVQEVNPFTTEVCRADLIRCPEVDPSAEIDSLDYYSKEYARSIRLLKVKQRWCHTTPSDWFKEVNVITAMDNNSNDLDPWPPFSEWLALFHVDMQGAPARIRSKIKAALLKKLEAMAKMKMAENKAAVIELFEARSTRPAVDTFQG